MFDIDGTLVQFYDFDERCFIASVKDVTGIDVNSDWQSYPHVTDKGILMGFIEKQAPHYSLEQLEAEVKSNFISRIKAHLNFEPAREVKGAIRFLSFTQATHRDLTLKV